MLGFLTGHSQVNKQITIDYKLLFAEKSIEEQKSDRALGIKQITSPIFFKLYVNDSISYFTQSNGINNSDFSIQMAMADALYDLPLYLDKNNKFYQKTNFIFGKYDYLIEKESINSWTITSESKLIDNKKCYKATAKDFYYHSFDKKIDFEVIAWFCPELPFNFGPFCYNNLPGLILEVTYLKATFVATKINFAVDESKIIKPIGTKTINSFELIQVVENNLIEFKERQKQKKINKK